MNWSFIIKLLAVILFIVWFIAHIGSSYENYTVVHHISFRAFYKFYILSPNIKLWKMRINPIYAIGGYHAHKFVIKFNILNFYIYQIFRIYLVIKEKRKAHNDDTVEFLGHMHDDILETLKFIETQNDQASKDAAKITTRILQEFQKKYGVFTNPDDVRSEPFG